MIISKKELLGLYGACYDKATQVSELNKEITSDLKGFAEHNELDPKSVKAGYQTYKKYRSGSINPSEDTFVEIQTIIEDSFGG